MELTREYDRTWLDAKSLRSIIDRFLSFKKAEEEIKYLRLLVDRNADSWKYDSLEEFFAETSKPARYAGVSMSISDSNLVIHNWSNISATSVSVSAKSREQIVTVFNEVDACAKKCYLPLPPPPIPQPKIEPEPEPFRVFIGHGGSLQWRDLKDHLQDQHHYEVIAYETGARAGHEIRDVIQEMLQKSSFAVLVMTGEDEQPDGKFRARQNVIHEIGLFQGKLGFHRAIVLVEDSTETFSNIAGVQQIRYSKDRIKETFGDVLAALKREQD